MNTPLRTAVPSRASFRILTELLPRDAMSARIHGMALRRAATPGRKRESRPMISGITQPVAS